MNDGAPLGSLILLLLPLVLIGFLLWSTRRRQRALEQFTSGLSVGEEVVLTSGLYGRVTELDESTALLQIAPGTVVRVDRRAIGARAADLAGAPSASTGTGASTGTNPGTAGDPTDPTERA